MSLEHGSSEMPLAVGTSRFGERWNPMPALRCAQCERPLPAERAEAARWKLGDLALADELDDVAVAMLLCPDCIEEDRVHAYDEGEAD